MSAIAKQLRSAEARRARLKAQENEAQAERDRLIRELAAAGHSHTEIHTMLGGAITRARIGQIAKHTQPQEVAS